MPVRFSQESIVFEQQVRAFTINSRLRQKDDLTSVGYEVPLEFVSTP